MQRVASLPGAGDWGILARSLVQPEPLMGSSDEKRIEIPPASAAAFVVEAGRTVRIVDVAGGQAGDFVALARGDFGVRLSQSRTRVESGSCRVTAGDSLWTNAQPPEVMFTLVADTAGAHSLLFSPCCRYALRKRFGVDGEGCLEHLAEALAPWGLSAADVPDPLSLFFDVALQSDGAMSIGPMTSAPGATLELRAEIDALVAVSTCPVPRPGKPEPTGYRVAILG